MARMTKAARLLVGRGGRLGATTSTRQPSTFKINERIIDDVHNCKALCNTSHGTPRSREDTKQSLKQLRASPVEQARDVPANFEVNKWTGPNAHILEAKLPVLQSFSPPGRHPVSLLTQQSSAQEQLLTSCLHGVHSPPPVFPTVRSHSSSGASTTDCMGVSARFHSCPQLSTRCHRIVPLIHSCPQLFTLSPRRARHLPGLCRISALQLQLPPRVR
eukprot:350566-Chlamydomonas_euryale.AAC.1